MARKRRKATSEAQGENIFQALARQGRDMNAYLEPEASKETAGPDVGAALERLDRLEAENRELQRRLVLAAPAPTVIRQEPAMQITARDVPLKFDDLLVRDEISGSMVLKDPAALATRITSYMEAREAATREELTTRQQTAAERQTIEERLWEGFKEKYPQWAEHEEIVDLVSGRVAREAKERGVDIQRYMIQHSDLFYADVAAALQKQYGALVEDEEDGENEALPEHLTVGRTAKTAAPDNDLDDGRTAGIFGGTESGGAPARRGAAPAEPRGDEMARDLMAVQSKMNLY